MPCKKLSMFFLGRKNKLCICRGKKAKNIHADNERGKQQKHKCQAKILACFPR